VAVICGPGFTGLFLSLVCLPIGCSGRLSQFLVSALAGKEPLFVECLPGAIPAIEFSQQLPGDDGHGLVSRHFRFILFLVIDGAVEAALSDQWQSNGMQDLSEQLSALFADLVLTLEGAALSSLEIKTRIAHELSPMFKVGERPGFGQEPCEVLGRDHVRSGRRDQRIILPQLFQNGQHLVGDPFLSFEHVEVVVQPVVEIFLEDPHVSFWHLVQDGAAGIRPQTFQGARQDARSCFSHLFAKEIVAVLDNPIGVASILLDQGQARIAVQEVLFERIVAEELHQQFADPAANAGDGNIAFVVNFMQLSEHQVLLADHSEPDDLVQFSQGSDHPGIFFVGLVAVVALHDPELGNGLGIHVIGEKTESTSGPHQFVLKLSGRFADHPQTLSAVFPGDVMIAKQALFDDGGAVAASVGEFLAVDFEEKTQGVLVDVHRDIDNVIEVDFLGSTRNLHKGFSFLGLDSAGCERQPSYCTSDLEGEAFFFAA
jgi:hypothetical protein